MEAQLRRLWPRRKSLKQSNKPDIKDVPSVPVRSGFEYNESYEATLSGTPPEMGTLPLKPSDNAKSRKSFGHSKAQSAGLQEFRKVTNKDSHIRTKSAGGIQPILVGISRPVGSGSMQKSVMEAGNVNGRSAPTSAVQRPNTAATLPNPVKAQRFQSAPKRYVDIMSFVATDGKHLEDYNEEVAARNLDLKTLAVQSATTTRVPKSKYQEEVASRNAATIGYKHRASLPMRSVPEGRRSNSLDSRVAMNVLPPAALPPYRHEGVALPGKTRSVQESAAYHSRTGSATSKSSNILPVIPQEISTEDAERAIPWLGNQYESGQRSNGNGEPDNVLTRYPSMHSKNTPGSATQTASLSTLPKSVMRANQSRPIASGISKEQGQPLHSNPYRAAAAENVFSAETRPESKRERPLTSRTASKSSRHRGDEMLSTTEISSSRESSPDRVRSYSPYKKSRDRANRTYMDITQDETEHESQHESPNTDYHESPTLAQATADMVQLHRAHVVGSTSRGYQDMARPPKATTHGISMASLQPSNQESKRRSSAFSDSSSLRNEQLLAFSTVTTLSSTSPASRPVSKVGPAPDSARNAKSRGRGSQNSTAQEAALSDIARPLTSEDGAEQKCSVNLEPLNSTEEPVSHVDTPKSYTGQQSSLASQTPQVLYTSPESLSSGDFIDPSRSFGVLTRDFASTPSRHSVPRSQLPHQSALASASGHSSVSETKRPMSQPVTAHEQKRTPRNLGFEHKSDGISSKLHELPAFYEPSSSPQLDHVDTPVEELKASSFDEAEFARKQTQARAALLRLQMSLEEQYDMSPGRPDSSTQRHVARQILDQTRKPQPAEKKTSTPPTSMYYEKKEYDRKVKPNRPAPLRAQSEDAMKAGNGYSYEKAGPNTFAQTVYSAVTITLPNTRALTAPYAKSPSAGSASHSFNYSNSATANDRSRAHSTLPNPPLTPVLPSPAPTEVSLSSFPMPQSPENRGRRRAADPERPRTARMQSTKSSVASIASVYSIPHHMVPARDSSRRDSALYEQT